MRATAILMIEYEVESLHPSDPAVAAMDDATNTILAEICHRVLDAGVRAGRVRAFTVPSSEVPGE